jgi:hypothetical protein
MTVKDVLKNPLVLLLAAALPIAFYRHPPIMDAPNHIARVWLESQGGLTGLQGEAYVVDWSRASSNILVDLVGAPLMRAIGLDAFWVVVTLLMILAAPLAAILISRDLNGRNNPWQAMALCAAWGQSTISGFISFSLSVALALGFSLLKLKLRKHGGFAVRVLIDAVAVLLLYLAHPFGIVLFLAFEFAMLLGPDTAAMKALTKRKVVMAFGGYAMSILPTLAYIALNRGNNPLDLSDMDYRSVVSHVVSLFSPFFAYNPIVEVALFAVIAISVAVAIGKRRVAFHTGLLVSVAILGALSLIIPDRIGTASWLTRRLPLMAALLFCVAIRNRDESQEKSEPLALLCSLAIVFHAAWVMFIWREREQDYVDLVEVSRAIPASSMVITGETTGPPSSWDDPGKYVHGAFIRAHLPALLVPLSRAFVPILFAVKGQQPLHLSSRFERLQSQLAAIPDERGVLSTESSDQVVETWKCDYDYLLVLKHDAGARYARPLKDTRMISTSNFADLLKIERPATCR